MASLLQEKQGPTADLQESGRISLLVPSLSTEEAPATVGEKKYDSADPDGCDWTIPTEVAGMEGSGWAALADRELPQGFLQDGNSSAAEVDEVASHHSQELEEGSNESCCGSEVRLADQKADQQEKDDHLWDLKQRIAHVGKGSTQSSGATAEVMAQLSQILQQMSEEQSHQCPVSRIASQLLAMVSQEAPAGTSEGTEACSAKELQEQLKGAKLEVAEKDKECWRLKRQKADLEGQAAYLYYTKKPWIKPEGLYPDLLPLRSDKLQSADQDIQARKKFAAATKRTKTGEWHWQHPGFSKVVRFLAPSEAAAGVLGMGGWSVGPVEYGEMLWENGDRLPCAFKKVPYERHVERCRADAELAALRDAAGCPHIVQCYGAFDHREPADGKHYLWIAMQQLSPA